MKCVYTHAYMCLSLPGEGTVDHYCVQFWFFGMCVRETGLLVLSQKKPLCVTAGEQQRWIFPILSKIRCSGTRSVSYFGVFWTGGMLAWICWLKYLNLKTRSWKLSWKSDDFSRYFGFWVISDFNCGFSCACFIAGLEYSVIQHCLTEDTSFIHALNN